jgi:sugar phosphate isomerase/epimerase
LAIGYSSRKVRAWLTRARGVGTERRGWNPLGAIKSPSLALNWDPANAVMRGEMDAYPVAWEMLPKNRIHHCHVKNAVRSGAGKVEWSPVDSGFIDWAGQFRALKQAGFRDATSLETHWHGAASAEESSRISWAGMKKALSEADAV